MRAIFFILILAVAALLIAIATGLIDINQTRPAEVPAVAAGDGGVTATGGQTPAFDIETGSVAVGTTNANVIVPTVEVTPANQQAGAEANAASNAAQ